MARFWVRLIVVVGFGWISVSSLGCQGDIKLEAPQPTCLDESACQTTQDCPNKCYHCVDGCCHSLECNSDDDCPPEEDLMRFCPQEIDPNGCRVCNYVRCVETAQCLEPQFPLYVECSPDMAARCFNGSCSCVPFCGGSCNKGKYCCHLDNLCLDLPKACADVTCPACEVPNPDPGGAVSSATCRVEGADCRCVSLPELKPALEGLYSALALSSTGTPLLSGYLGAPYGDLLYGVASLDERGVQVDWNIVDGIPEAAPCEGAADGPRGGIAEPGDDVGQDTDIVIDSQDRPRISYYDATAGDLKYAFYDGATWQVHVVDSMGVTGRYTSIALDDQNRPIIAYMTVRASSTSSLNVAWAEVAFPNSDTDWTIYTVDSTKLGCIQSECESQHVCLSDSGVCESIDDPASCEKGEGCVGRTACVAGECRALMPETTLDDLPVGVGLFADLDLFKDGTVMVVYYDSVRGNLKSALFDSEADGFTPPIILAGEDEDGQDQGDLGTDCSLIISDDDQVHIVFQDADFGRLYYLNASEGMVEMIDAGARDEQGFPVDEDRAASALHWVGNYAHIVADWAGNLRVAYQDGTSLDLLVAFRGPTDTWEVAIMDRKQVGEQFVGAYGFFVDQALSADGASVHISNFVHDLRNDPFSSRIDLRTHRLP